MGIQQITATQLNSVAVFKLSELPPLGFSFKLFQHTSQSADERSHVARQQACTWALLLSALGDHSYVDWCILGTGEGRRVWVGEAEGTRPLARLAIGGWALGWILNIVWECDEWIHLAQVSTSVGFFERGDGSLKRGKFLKLRRNCWLLSRALSCTELVS
jgi:hypothetical protein